MTKLAVTAAVITTPTHLHENLILSCLKAGKAVFCEKPIATKAEGIGKNSRNFITSVNLQSSRRNISRKTTQPRSQGFSLLVGGGREKTLASAGHVTFRHPKILGVINFGLHEF